MLQLAGSPVGTLAPQVDDAPLDRRSRLARRTLGTAAVLLDPGHSPIAIALQPKIASRPRNAKLGTQSAQIFLSLLSPYHKLHPLIAYSHRSPPHSRPPSSGRFTLPHSLRSRGSVKDVVITTVKNVMEQNRFTAAPPKIKGGAAPPKMKGNIEFSAACEGVPLQNKPQTEPLPTSFYGLDLPPK